MKAKMKWSIKRAAINLNDIEDEDTKAALSEVQQLVKKNKVDEAILRLPQIDFEFDAESMDTDPSDYFIKTNYSFIVDRSNKNHQIRIGMDGKRIIISISVVFEVKIHDGISPADFDTWLSENGGWYAGYAAGQWSYTDDDGGECHLIS